MTLNAYKIFQNVLSGVASVLQELLPLSAKEVADLTELWLMSYRELNGLEG